MALDPSLSLDVAGGGGQGAPPLPGTGGIGNSLAGFAPLIQAASGINQLRAFQQNWNARQRMGQIMAAAPDLNSGLATAQQDPQVAGWFPEGLNTMRAMQLAQTQTQGFQQQQIQNGVHAVINTAASALKDPALFDSTLQASLAGMPPGVRAEALPFVQTWRQAMTDGLPADKSTWTPAQTAQFQNRVAGSMIGWGVDAGAIRNYLGTMAPQTVQTTGPQGQAQTRVIGGPIVPEEGNAMAPGGAGAGGGPSPTAGNALAPSPPAASGASGASGSALSGSVLASGPSAYTLATGKDLATRFAGPELDEFQGAQRILGSLTTMRGDLDTLARAGGFTTPGTALDIRTNLARAANTLLQATGNQPYFDPGAVGASESFQKETRRMAVDVTKQFLGGNHQAAETINGITQSVPGVGNSVLGSALLIDGLTAAAQRVVDRRDFKLQWAQQHNGDLTGADEAFNNSKPAEGYANQVLEKYGMTPKGFGSVEDLGKAVRAGWLTPKEAAGIAAKQWPDQFHLPGTNSPGAGGPGASGPAASGGSQ